MNKNQVLATLATIDYTRFGVKSLELFGSVARDESGVTSDVDILVEFEETPTFDHYIGLKFYLEDLLGTKVDLVEKALLHPSIRSTVEDEVISVA